MNKVVLIIINCFCLLTGLFAQVKDTVLVNQRTAVVSYKPIAAYKGNIEELGNALSKKYDKNRNLPSGDSVWVFNAFVDQEPLNDLQDIKLLEGAKSVFSDFMLQELKHSGKAWIPMYQGGRAVKSYIRINVRLHSNGNITMTTGI